MTETKAPTGYLADSTPQTVTVEADNAQTITFRNAPYQTLIIRKLASDSGNPLSGVWFHVTDQDGSPLGSSNGDYVTDQNGQIVIENLIPGMTVTARETRTVSGYILNNEAQTIRIRSGEAQTLTFLNSPKGSLTIRKVDALTDQPLSGAEFRVTSVNGEPVADNEGRTSSNGIFHTDTNGQFTIVNLQPGVYTVTETKAPTGYVMDAAPQTVAVEADERSVTRPIRH